jgi:hypothetical protein
MANHIQKLGDNTTKNVVPDFEGERFYHWQHMRTMAEKAGTLDRLPRKPRSGLAEKSFFEQVDRRISRQTYMLGVSFDKDGKVIRH